jgi:hypothetical protein
MTNRDKSEIQSPSSPSGGRSAINDPLAVQLNEARLVLARIAHSNAQTKEDGMSMRSLASDYIYKGRTSPAPGVDVLPLNWIETFIDRGDGSQDSSGWEAESGFGPFYTIEMYFGSDSYGWEVLFDSAPIGDFDDPDKAKAFAQTDFAKRVLAALQPASDGAGVRTCTCHPDDNPPVPCAQKFAYSECAKPAAEPQGAGDMRLRLAQLQASGVKSLTINQVVGLLGFCEAEAANAPQGDAVRSALKPFEKWLDAWHFNLRRQPMPDAVLVSEEGDRRAVVTAKDAFALLAALGEPVAYFRTLNGEIDWSEDCCWPAENGADDPGEHPGEEGYGVMPLYPAPSPALDRVEARPVDDGNPNVPVDRDAKLPCDVFLPPATRIRAGCKLQTLLTALEVRSLSTASAAVTSIHERVSEKLPSSDGRAVEGE